MVLSKDFKKAICFGLIVGCIISIFQLVGFCVETEDVSFDVVSGLTFDNLNVGTRQLVEGSYNIGYVEIEPGYQYTFSNGFAGMTVVGFGDSVPTVGDYVELVAQVTSGSTYSFKSSDVNYLYFDFISGNNMTITRTKLEGITNVVDNIAYSLSYVNLNQIFSNVVPLLAISVLIGLGFYLLKRIINKLKKAKGGI